MDSILIRIVFYCIFLKQWVVVGLAHTVGRRLSLPAQSQDCTVYTVTHCVHSVYCWFYLCCVLLELHTVGWYYLCTVPHSVCNLHCWYNLYTVPTVYTAGTISAGPKLAHSWTNYLLLLPFLLKLPIFHYVDDKTYLKTKPARRLSIIDLHISPLIQKYIHPYDMLQSLKVTSQGVGS